MSTGLETLPLPLEGLDGPEPAAAAPEAPRPARRNLTAAQIVPRRRIQAALPEGPLLSSRAWGAVIGACDGYAATIVDQVGLPPWPPKAPRQGASGRKPGGLGRQR